MANTSSANGKRAFLDEEPNHEAVDHFQGLEQFREEGLPQRLPAQKEAEMSRHPEVTLIEQQLEHCDSEIHRDELRREIVNLLKRLKSLALKQYQKAWIKEQRDLRILTRGKLTTGGDPTEEHILISLYPERQRISVFMKLDEGLTDIQMRQAGIDLYSLCTRDCTAVYRPGEEPTIDDKCPVCGCKMER